MDITVKNLFAKISPRKARLVLHGLRGLSAAAARDILLFTNKKGARICVELVKSGIAAAKENYLEADKVFVKSISCGEGPRLKRHMPKSKGRTYLKQKRMSHFILTLSDEIPAEKTEKEIKVQAKNSKKEEK